jgi:hypothetical protein
MTDVPIYDNKGVQVDSFFIDDTLTPVNGRVSKGDKGYYKGAGVKYSYHMTRSPQDNEESIRKSDVWYVGWAVRRDEFMGKTGVFQVPYQPHFTDWIGACGEKEIQIVENLWELNFDRSNVDVKGFEEIAPGQFYLTCDYPDGRQTYLQDPNPRDLMSLFGYMVDNHWNFPWDKRSITDITPTGKVNDVADIFQSKGLGHRIGSIYSVLYSMGMMNPGAYQQFCEQYMLGHGSHAYYVTNALAILMRLGINIDACMKDTLGETYWHTVEHFLVTGKNCGYCGVGSCKGREDPNQLTGDVIKEEYIRQIQESKSK